MKNKIIATAILVVMGLMIFAPAANAQIFYFNTKSGGFQSIHSNNNTTGSNNSFVEKNDNTTNTNNIFYFFSRFNYNNTVTQPTKPVEPKQPVQPTKPVEPTQPSKPVPQEPKVEDKDVSTGTNSIVNAEEVKMLEYINQERAKAGVAPLQMDSEVAKVAQIKSQDMVDNNYFSHTSPNYGSPFDMMKKFGISYRAAGENIARNSSMLKAHTALMNSEGHRQNILNPNYTHIGIGIVQNKNYSGITVTQMFIKK